MILAYFTLCKFVKYCEIQVFVVTEFHTPHITWAVAVIHGEKNLFGLVWILPKGQGLICDYMKLHIWLDIHVGFLKAPFWGLCSKSTCSALTQMMKTTKRVTTVRQQTYIYTTIPPGDYYPRSTFWKGGFLPFSLLYKTMQDPTLRPSHACKGNIRWIRNELHSLLSRLFLTWVNYFSGKGGGGGGGGGALLFVAVTHWMILF